MRAGPKRAVTAPPLDLSGLGRQRATRAVRFIGEYVTVPRGKGAGKRARLRPWQRKIIRGALAPGVRQALVSVPRGNGKSALAAMLAVWELFDGPEGAQALTVASDERQARITWNLARRMIELDERLSARVQVFQDRIVEPRRDAVLAPLPAEPDALQGFDPSLVVVDELHVVREDTYEAMQLAAGKRHRSLLLAISTPAGDRDGVMYRLVEHGRAGDDPAFYFAEFAAPDGCDPDDEDAWREANPALHDFLHVDALRASRRTVRESSFRRFRLGQWAAGDDAWADPDGWDALADESRVVEPGARIVAGFDGSASGDSTALVAATVEPRPHVFTVGLWENPGDRRWRVPRAEVDARVDELHALYDVVEFPADPWGWRSELEAWQERHGTVVEWPTNVLSRMGPATDRASALINEGRLSHDGNPDLARHVRNAVAKATPHGDVVVKDKRMSERKIDAAVAMIVAVDRAVFHAQRKPKRKRMMVV